MIKEANQKIMEQKPYSATAAFRKRPTTKGDILSNDQRTSKVSTNFTGLVPHGGMMRQQNDSQGFNSGGVFSQSGKYRSNTKTGTTSVGSYVNKPVK